VLRPLWAAESDQPSRPMRRQSAAETMETAELLTPVTSDFRIR